MSEQIIIIGSGISGATLAERYATRLNKKVLILEKRNHIGGNCFDYYNEHGIRISKYGAHLFHTNYEDVWSYVNTFSKWYPYEHRVLAKVDNKLVPVPVTIKTVNSLLGTTITNEKEMKEWLLKNQVHFAHPKNSEEAALSRVGQYLYEKLFKNYTKKQWNKYPAELEPEVLERIPVRTTYDDRYFTDKYQYLPQEGYTPIFNAMLDHPNISIQLNTDYFTVKDKYKTYEKLFYTGPIDQYFNYKYANDAKLEYRSIRFEQETYNKEYFQENSVINYPNEEEFTRIVEYKYLTYQKHQKTTIVKEYPTDYGEPYYPVPTAQNRAIYNQYRKEAELLETQKIYFVGRLANYKYFNMDQAFKNALDLFSRIEKIHA